jgi:tetratricopeptide (TPR) repeat protein
MDLREPLPRFGMPPAEFVRTAAALLEDRPGEMPPGRSFRILENRLDQGSGRGALLDGIVLAPAGVARRDLPALPPIDESTVRTEKVIRTLTTLAAAPAGPLVTPEQTIGQVGTQLASLPEDRAAQAAIGIARHYARLGRWDLARQLFLLVVSRYSATAEAADACRWLILHDTSAEVRRRLELRQFKVHTQVVYSGNSGDERTIKPAFAEAAVCKMQGAVKISASQDLSVLETQAEEKQWYEQSLELGKKLVAQDPKGEEDPAVLFSLQSARRKLGKFDEARQWYSSYRQAHASGPWTEVAAAESWLTNRVGPPPRPVAVCAQTEMRPNLDGLLEETCWAGKPLAFRNAMGDTLKTYPTEAWLSYDRDYLYLALRCRQPPGKYVAPVRPRSRDADLRGFDHVSLIVDLDRDYATYYRLEVDQRGCVAEDCWGDRSWDPQWFVAIQSGPASWQIEAAIPLAELSGHRIKPGETWAFNLTRVIPGRGIQAFSTPADVEPRTDGLGLLMFSERPTAAQAGK